MEVTLEGKYHRMFRGISRRLIAKSEGKGTKTLGSLQTAVRGL
jgi:hypothetical protein